MQEYHTKRFLHAQLWPLRTLGDRCRQSYNNKRQGRYQPPPSGNVKGFFTVVHPFCVLSREVAIETIRQHLGDAIADRCDPQGLFATYLTPSIKEAMNLAKGVVVKPVKVKHHHKMYRSRIDRKMIWRLRQGAGSAADLATLMLSWSKRGIAGLL